MARPEGLPQASDFEIVELPRPSPAEGEVLVEVCYLSLDPAMRGWMRDRPSYLPPVGLGEVMRATGVGRVVASNDATRPVGSYVVGLTGVQELACLEAAEVMPADPAVAPLSAYLGVLGITGLTAYFGLFDVGQPQAGETVLVSGAAGATGSVVGQLAKLHGCRAVGIAGGPQKCAHLIDGLGFDAAVDYKEGGGVGAALDAACPDGVDVYFDNVGGRLLDLALARINRRARVVLCGGISQYNATRVPRGPGNYLALLVQRARMEGFIVLDYRARFREARDKLARWLAAGELTHDETVAKGGVDAFLPTFLRLFSGEKRGKLVLAVNPPDDP